MRFVPGHLGVRALAVILAFLLWVHVVTDKRYEYFTVLPLRITGIQDDLLLVSNPPSTCEVLVRGNGKQLLRFIVEAGSLSINASSYSTGLYVIDATPENLTANHKSAVEIVEIIAPRKLRLQFEERMEKVVSVQPEIEITPALGYLKEGELRVIPDTVTVSGPRRLVRAMRTISTEQLVYTDIRANLREQISLLVPDTARIVLSDSTVMIEQDITALRERTFRGIPVRTRGGDMPSGYAVVPESISVTVEAPQVVLDSLSADQFEVWIDVSAAMPGSTYVAPKVSFPSGLRAVNIKPNEILIEVPRE